MQSLPPPRTTNQFAVWSLVASASGCATGIGAVVGVVFGVIALRQMAREPRRYDGRGLAIAGVVVGGVIVLAMAVVVFAIVGSIVTCEGGAWPDGCR